MHPAFFVLHHEGKPLIKSWPNDAWGSFEAFLHPASVHAEMVVTNLKIEGTMHDETGKYMMGSDARNKKAECTASTRENEADAYLLESACKASELVILFVDYRDKQ